MAVRLKVYQDGDEPIKTKDFEAENITIGREQSSDLRLEDSSKFVSRQHAVIKYQDGYYYLVDKDSRNGTYINNKRIKADYPYTLDDDSSFVIGEYTIQFSTVQEEPKPSNVEPPRDRTMVYSNPFQDEMDSLLEVFQEIERKHQSSKELATTESLEEAIKFVKANIQGLDTLPVILATLSNGTGTDQRKQAQTSGDAHTTTNVSVGDDRLEKVLDVSLEFFVNIFRFVSKFRTEFVGSTLVETEDIMSVKNIGELKQILFDKKMSTDEMEEQVEQIHREMRKLVAHQVGLLEGYRDSIRQGVPKLTKELNPAIVINEISNENLTIGPVNIPYKYIPFIVKNKALQKLEENHFSLTEEDRGVIEKKYFRPPFIKKYLETISSS